ncbi:MAG TPA: hypothetical protein VK188_17520 [Holophaga sp.]|nr:hypothetical protein [Holophaga sp.]
MNEEPGLCDLALAVLEAGGFACEAFTDPGAAKAWLARAHEGIDLLLTGPEPPCLDVAAAAWGLREDLPVVMCLPGGAARPSRQGWPPNVVGGIELPFHARETVHALAEVLARTGGWRRTS